MVPFPHKYFISLCLNIFGEGKSNTLVGSTVELLCQEICPDSWNGPFCDLNSLFLHFPI